MTQALTFRQIDQLKACLSMAQDPAKHEEAAQAFAQLQHNMQAENPMAAEMLNLLWTDLLSARRSVSFWQQICDVEKELSDRIAANHVQLRQNYLRLMQEQ